jgi:tetratricopeptide (TPR) repeat protein
VQSGAGPGGPTTAPTPFVGREDELDLLAQVYRRGVRERSPQLVTLSGEPGMGKGRLAAEFRRTIEEQGDAFVWLQGRCLPYNVANAFWAVGELIKDQAGILESDAPVVAARKLADAVQAVVDDPAERDWFEARLGPLVGAAGGKLSGSVDRAEWFTAWRRFFEAIAAKVPLVLVLSDVQWAEPSLMELLEHLLDRAAGVPLLVVCLAWPELFDAYPGWGGGKRGSTTIALSRLTEEETARLISALLGQAALPADVQRLLIERSGGIPLFAEQFVRMLIDREILVRQGHTWRLRPEPSEGAHAGEEFPTPGSIQALIGSRLASLPPAARSLLQDAAVMGRTFWLGSVAAISGSARDRVQQGLHELARREFVRPGRASQVRDEPQYSFWHALVRNAAYGQIPAGERVGKHVAAAEWIERATGDRAADLADIIAYHYEQAIELQAGSGTAAEPDLHLAERAAAFSTVAGERALQLDVAKAGSYFSRALALIPEDDPVRPALLGRLAETAFLSGEFEDAVDLYQRSIDGLRAQGDRARAGEALLDLAYILWNQGWTENSREVLAEAVEGLEAERPGPALARAYAQMAGDRFLAGSSRDALAWCEKALALAERAGGAEQRVRALEVRGMARCDLGDWEGLADLREALRMAIDQGLGEETVRCYINLGTFVTPVEGPDAALALFRAGIELAERRGIRVLGMWTRAWALGVLFELGRWDELIQTAHEVIEWERPRGGSQLGVGARLCEAEAQVYRGDQVRARELTDEFLPRARDIGDPQVLTPALVVAALVRRADGDRERTVALLEELEQSGREGSAWVRTLFLQVAVRLAVEAGRDDLAERLMEGAEREAPRSGHSLLSSRAVLAEASGDLDAAAGAYAEAAERWKAYGFPFEQALALLGRGRVLLRRGIAGEARGALAEARELFANLRAIVLVAEVDELVKGSAGRSG